MGLGFIDTIALFVSLAITILFVVPFTGVLVRFRANYNPKALQLDAEGGAAPHTGPVINSYFAMMARVYRLEGVYGLYKGFMPTALVTFIVTIVILIFMDAAKPRHGSYRAPEAGPLGMLLYSIGMMLISLPAAIITYRSITTPHKLGWLDFSKSLRVLLTPTERRKPWILYLTPGLLSAEVLHILIVVLFLGPLHRLLLPAVVNPDLDPFDISLWKAAIYFVIVAIATIVLAPLEVISTRLAIQRNHASSEYNSVAQEIEGDAEETDDATANEEVIGLRHEADPYIGLIDCGKRIIDEEGVAALYRAWWITLLGGLASAFT